MDKKIILEMQENKNIEITVNGEIKLTIEKKERTIKADDIYMLLDHSPGDKYSIEIVNKKGIDKPVIEFFSDLLNDITEQLP
ncbi:hypothetical protein IX317_000584 [Fusobacterium sp. DD29]|uniref:hypothetical protein n=1 Tax=unclassified Fusobacterium TaxID=2648384 RepID=UPI001B8B91B5|nr:MULTISPECIES: hypothetical protein [unclassified Fusobacterium]MBR8700677.1 hypothetical protein [Fusobacterium sp. DD45]MBR8710768.1 hypothetical protein [Fusobacterium sp. DD28]MBR8748923.1 hypothetical protein [Fusobacterium sp. DD29]MBR8751376.1 hypothetical protein [Fusobacterium sp. DD26]MBR8761175.1 hypothetical protein [Fusobacterium sp. DD25]